MARQDMSKYDTSGLDEKVLDDNYPVHFDYLYVVNNNYVFRSDIRGTVKDLKRDYKKLYGEDALEVKSCDIIGRQKLQSDE